jgi:hypothetical protein
MNKGRWMGLVASLTLVCVLLFLGACQAVAQQARVNVCKDDNTPKDLCAEVTLRYFDSGRVDVVDTKSGLVIPECRICNTNTDKDCKLANPCRGSVGSTIDHATTLQLFQTHKSPGCTLFCSGNNYCRELCR